MVADHLLGEAADRGIVRLGESLPPGGDVDLAGGISDVSDLGVGGVRKDRSSASSAATIASDE